MVDKEIARQQIAQVVAQYQKMTAKERAGFTEQQTRISLILPLFKALGWNIENAAEVSAEEKIESGFADFGFYLNGVPVFYLETKRLREGIHKLDYIKQAINYAYLKGVTWAVLSDFDGLAVYNAEWETDHPSEAHVFSFSAETYTGEHFDDLWLLSREAMLNRELDRFAERFGVKRRKTPITEVLLADFTRWRRELFAVVTTLGEKLWSRNPQEVDNAIQRLFDRLIFLRAAEDRGIEEGHLKQVLRQKLPSQRLPTLMRVFRQMDEVYNSNLFAYDEIDDLDLPDPDLLKEIIDGLYKVQRGGYGVYDFRAVSADILGRVYEGYLGFKAQDPEGKQVHGEKSAKRKAQGIFYTPQFVVRYIVQNTLGRLLESGVDPHALRVLDPACGSGSFLIEAFDVLDRWIKAHEPALPDAERRRRILTENLYGVDLDEQAVEVTRLNLLLRASLERGKLPMLTHIQVGNSLIADPAVAGDQAFVWEERFSEVMAAGGFDVVIGNPPYVRQERLGADFKRYTEAHYESYAGGADLYVYFIEKGIKLLRDGGMYGVIVANKWLRAAYGKPLRAYLKNRITAVVDFGELPVFADAATFPAILVAMPNTNAPVSVTNVKSLDFVDLQTVVNSDSYTVRRNSLGDENWSLVSDKKIDILDKMRSVGVPLGIYVNQSIYYGIKTGYNEAFVISAGTRDELIKRDPKSTEIIKPFVVGDDVRRYKTIPPERYLILFPKGWTHARMGETVSEEYAWRWLKDQYPAVVAYLAPFADRARKRGDKGDYWWELRACSYYDQFAQAKIIYPDIAKESRATYDTSGLFFGNTVYFIPLADLYLLGVLNSNLVFEYMKANASVLGDAEEGGRLRWFSQDVERIPIPRLNLTDPAQKAAHDQIVQHVTRLIALKQERAAVLFEGSDDAIRLDQLIAHHDRAIDRIVYQLYGLTDDEIALVETA